MDRNATHSSSRHTNSAGRSPSMIRVKSVGALAEPPGSTTGTGLPGMLRLAKLLSEQMSPDPPPAEPRAASEDGVGDDPPVASAPSGLSGAVVAFRHRDFTLFWIGAFVSNIGTWMQAVTVPYVLYQLTGSAVWVGLAAFLGLFPGVILGPVAGPLADRLPRRQLLLWSQVVQASLAFALWGSWEAGFRSPGLLLGLIGLNGLVFGGTMPAWQAFVAELVPRDELLNAVALNSAQFNGARAIGPAIGGAALAAFGPSWAFLLNGLSFFAVIAALLLVRLPYARQVVTGVALSVRAINHEFVAGARYTRRHAGILLAVALVAVVSFVGSPIFQLLPIVATQVFAVGPGLYGLLTAAYGVGAVVGASALGVMGSRFRRSRITVGALCVFGLGLAGIGGSPAFGLGVAAVLVTGVGFLCTVATLMTSVQVLVAEEMRGRVLSLYMMSLTAMLPLGALAQSWVAQTAGMRAVAVADGIVLVSLAALLATRPAVAGALDTDARRVPSAMAAADQPVAAARLDVGTAR